MEHFKVSDLGNSVRHFKGQRFAEPLQWARKWIKEPLTPACMLIDTCVLPHWPGRMYVSMRRPVCMSVSNTHSSHRRGPCSSRHNPGSFAEPEEERSLCVCACIFLSIHKSTETHRYKDIHTPTSDVLQVKIGDASTTRIGLIFILLIRLWVSSSNDSPKPFILS